MCFLSVLAFALQAAGPAFSIKNLTAYIEAKAMCKSCQRQQGPEHPFHAPFGDSDAPRRPGILSDLSGEKHAPYVFNPRILPTSSSSPRTLGLCSRPQLASLHVTNSHLCIKKCPFSRDTIPDPVDEVKPSCCLAPQHTVVFSPSYPSQLPRVWCLSPHLEGSIQE